LTFCWFIPARDSSTQHYRQHCNAAAVTHTLRTTIHIHAATALTHATPSSGLDIYGLTCCPARCAHTFFVTVTHTHFAGTHRCHLHRACNLPLPPPLPHVLLPRILHLPARLRQFTRVHCVTVATMLDGLVTFWMPTTSRYLRTLPDSTCGCYLLYGQFAHTFAGCTHHGSIPHATFRYRCRLDGHYYNAWFIPRTTVDILLPRCNTCYHLCHGSTLWLLLRHAHRAVRITPLVHYLRFMDGLVLPPAPYAPVHTPFTPLPRYRLFLLHTVLLADLGWFTRRGTAYFLVHIPATLVIHAVHCGYRSGQFTHYVHILPWTWFACLHTHTTPLPTYCPPPTTQLPLPYCWVPRCLPHLTTARCLPTHACLDPHHTPTTPPACCSSYLDCGWLDSTACRLPFVVYPRFCRLPGPSPFPAAPPLHTFTWFGYPGPAWTSLPTAGREHRFYHRYTCHTGRSALAYRCLFCADVTWPPPLLPLPPALRTPVSWNTTGRGFIHTSCLYLPLLVRAYAHPYHRRSHLVACRRTVALLHIPFDGSSTTGLYWFTAPLPPLLPAFRTHSAALRYCGWFGGSYLPTAAARTTTRLHTYPFTTATRLDAVAFYRLTYTHGFSRHLPVLRLPVLAVTPFLRLGCTHVPAHCTTPHSTFYLPRLRLYRIHFAHRSSASAAPAFYLSTLYAFALQHTYGLCHGCIHLFTA